MKQICLLSLLLLLISGCELPSSYTPDNYEEQYVVESYLVANEPLPHVIVNTTSPIDEIYSTKRNKVQNAQVQIRLLDNGGSIAEQYDFNYSENGIYIPTEEVMVKPEQQYQLFVTVGEQDTITAKTMVPGSFEAINQLNNSYIFKEDQQIQFITTPSSYPDRQTYYLFTAEALDAEEDNLTPFYSDLVEKGQWINSFYVNSTDITGGENYNTDKDGNLILNVPWSAIAFYGENKISINAIDDNIYHAWPSISPGIIGKGMTLSPGKTEELPNHINGGIGVFGSIAKTTQSTNILKKRNED